MNLNPNIQNDLKAFLSLAIEHSLDLYIEKAIDKPLPLDKDLNLPTNPADPESSKNKINSTEKYHKEFDNYLSHTKGCLGQIDHLLKLTITCLKNDVLKIDQNPLYGIDLQRLHFFNALDDVREINNSHKNTLPEN